jgi:DNA polymerase III subunit epsilon
MLSAARDIAHGTARMSSGDVACDMAPDEAHDVAPYGGRADAAGAPAPVEVATGTRPAVGTTAGPATRHIDDLGTPLHEVTFCVVDLETTGASPATCAITEVGAARFRGGVCEGTFRTLVDAELPVDPVVTELTGITDAMLRGQPPVGAVLAALAEFVGGAVLVGHNLRFDVSFLDAALAATGREPVGSRTVDTVALARRLLVDDDAADLRLGTLAGALRLPHQPSHRALDDVLATADLLHVLLERAAGLGVTVLDDLLEVPHIARHAPAAKLRLTARLPRSPGVYVLRDAQGAARRIAPAADVRRAVRALFSDDPGRGVRPLLRTVHAVDHVPCRSVAEATEVAARMGEEAGLRCATC